MPRPTRGRLRVLRGSVLGLMALLLGVAAHAAAGGGTPGLVEAALLAGLAASAGSLVAGRTLSLPSLLVFILASQALLHVLLAATAGHAQHETASLTSPAAVPEPAMLLAHLVAAGLTAWLLRIGESDLAAWSRFVSQRLGRALLAGVERFALPGSPPALVPVRIDDVPRRLVARTAIARRGPPSRCRTH